MWSYFSFCKEYLRWLTNRWFSIGRWLLWGLGFLGFGCLGVGGWGFWGFGVKIGFCPGRYSGTQRRRSRCCLRQRRFDVGRCCDSMFSQKQTSADDSRYGKNAGIRIWVTTKLRGQETRVPGMGAFLLALSVSILFFSGWSSSHKHRSDFSRWMKSEYRKAKSSAVGQK